MGDLEGLVLGRDDDREIRRPGRGRHRCRPRAGSLRTRMLLASRGAKVVVNDHGGSLAGDGADAGPAEQVVDAISAAGGEAVACTESVATRDGGDAIMQTALEHYGRLDILIHNAGNVRRGSLKEMSYEDFDAVLDVHLRGAFNVVRPAFPVMCAGRLRAHRADVVDRRPVRQPRCRQLRGRQGRRDRAVQCRGARRRRRRCDVQRDRAGRGDQDGRGHRHLGLSADGRRSSLRPWWAGWHTNPVR